MKNQYSEKNLNLDNNLNEGFLVRRRARVQEIFSEKVFFAINSLILAIKKFCYIINANFFIYYLKNYATIYISHLAQNK